MSKTIKKRGTKYLCLSNTKPINYKNPNLYLTGSSLNLPKVNNSLGFGNKETGLAGLKERMNVQHTPNPNAKNFSGESIEGLAGGITNITGGITGIMDSFTKNAQIADTTEIESNINEVKNFDVDGYNNTDSLIDSYNNQLALKSDYTGKDLRGLSTGEGISNTLSAIGSGFSAGSSLGSAGGPFGTLIGGGVGALAGLTTSIAGIFTGKRKAEKKAEELNRLALNAERTANMNFQNQLDEIQDIQHQNNIANLAAYGGKLYNKRYYAEGGPFNYSLGEGFLYDNSTDNINTSSHNRPYSNEKQNNSGEYTEGYTPRNTPVSGLFGDKNSDYADLAWGAAEMVPIVGNIMGIADVVNDIRNLYHDKHIDSGDIGNLILDLSGLIPGVSTFTKGAKDINNKKELGGPMNTHGGYFSNNIIKVDKGGTHEENPYEGVPMGIAPDGQPNLVEEGEVIFKDYVFSNRLYLNKKELEKARLPSKYDKYTFALAAEDINKESSERPNDPISKNGLNAMLGRLAEVQEMQRMKKGKKGTQQMMAFGGRKYSGVNDDPFIGSLDQALEEAELNYLASKSPEIQKGLSEIRGERNLGKPLDTSLRYAPALGSAIGALSSIFSKPDYTNSNLILNVANNLSGDRVNSKHINNYLTYKPLDRNYYLSKLQEQASATRAALRNSGSNPGQVMAGLLAADYNAQKAVGDTLMKMDMYNEQQRQAVEQFNRGTNQYNSQASMNADAQNAQLASMRDKMRLAGITTAAGMREATDTALANSKSMNLTNFFDNLGTIGQDNMAQNWRNRLIDVGYFGAGADRIIKKNGGLLTKRNRRRR